jgi:hypothetical protein
MPDLFTPSQLKTIQNVFLNPAFEVWQRDTLSGTQGSGFQQTYMADGWLFESDGTTDYSTVTTKETDVPTPAQAGYSALCSIKKLNSHEETGSNVYRYSQVNHVIEGLDMTDVFMRPSTITFWVKGSRIGKRYACVRDGGKTFSCLLPYEIFQADTWEKKILFVPPCPAGGVYSFGTGWGLVFCDSLFEASGWQDTPANSNIWTAGIATAGSDMVQLDQAGDYLQWTLFSWTPTYRVLPFWAPNFQQTLLRCMRRYQSNADYGIHEGDANVCKYDCQLNNGYAEMYIYLPVELRVYANSIAWYSVIGTPSCISMTNSEAQADYGAGTFSGTPSGLDGSSRRMIHYGDYPTFITTAKTCVTIFADSDIY